MAEVTKISWAHSTFNPWIGCSKISVGPLGACVNCYAEANDSRKLLGGVTHWGPGVPPNIWLGMTVGNQDELKRDMPKLAAAPAYVRWLSIAPMLERMSLAVIGYRELINWVVCEGEAAQRGQSRPFDIDWARQLRNQCHNYSIPFHMKQLGTRVVDRGEPYPHTGKGDDPAEWPEELRVQEFPR